jgi:ABC-type antimicrobial peptide transport system permease subunit
MTSMKLKILIRRLISDSTFTGINLAGLSVVLTFVLAGSVALTIALVTVSWQSWRAASKNPVDALRYE